MVRDQTADRARIGALEAELAEMREQVAQLRSQVLAAATVEPPPAAPPTRPEADDDPRRVSRRGLITGAAGAVAAGAAVVVGHAAPAAADGTQGTPWTLGKFDNSATERTGLRASNVDPVLLITNNGTSKGSAAQFYVHEPENTGAVTHHEGAGLGSAAEFITSNPVNTVPTVNASQGGHGMAGAFVVSNVTNNAAALGSSTTGTGPALSAAAKGGGNAALLSANGTNAALFVTMSGTGHGLFVNDTNTTSTNPTAFIQTTAPTAALRVKSQMANINLWPRTAAGAPTSDTVLHGAGDLVEDSVGNLWVCVGGGTPGLWRKLAGPATAGALHILSTPVRVYDSRPGSSPPVGSKTPLAKNVARTIDLTVNSSGVPAGATAAMVNLLIVGAPAGDANFTLWKNGVARPSSNTMVWGGSAGRFSTLAITALDNTGKAQVVSSVATDVVVDVVAYYR